MQTPRKSPGRNGFKYRQQFGVIILCKSEIEQAKTYKALKRQGKRVKVVTV